MKRILVSLLSLLLTFSLLMPIVAEDYSIELGGIDLVEGENIIGDGKATLITENNQLVLDNVTADGQLWIKSGSGDLEILVKGENSIKPNSDDYDGLYDARIMGSLNIKMEDNSSLNIETSYNGIYSETGEINIEGEWKFIHFN